MRSLVESKTPPFLDYRNECKLFYTDENFWCTMVHMALCRLQFCGDSTRDIRYSEIESSNHIPWRIEVPGRPDMKGPLVWPGSFRVPCFTCCSQAKNRDIWFCTACNASSWCSSCDKNNQMIEKGHLKMPAPAPHLVLYQPSHMTSAISYPKPESLDVIWRHRHASGCANADPHVSKAIEFTPRADHYYPIDPNLKDSKSKLL